jgi:glycosyltransferase involved in cell wall biosynthesis
MKLGLVTSYMAPHLGGIERIAEILFAGYAATSGVEVRWVSSHVPRDTVLHDGNRIRVPCFNLIEDLLGVPIPVWGPSGWRAVKEVTQWADAVHVLECLYSSSAIAVLLARRYRKPVVLSQNVGFIRYRSPVLNWVERAAYATLGRAVLRHASHVVLATPTAASYVATLFKHGLPRTSAFPIGIDTSLFRPAAGRDRHAARTLLGLPADEPMVLFSGRLVEKKGVGIVIDVSRRLPNIRFVITGDGPLRARLSEAPPNVVWHRTVGPDQMSSYYRAADCLILPSHGEGLPLVVQEAMASGLPVVISEDEPYAEHLLASEVCAAAPRMPDPMAARVRAIFAGEDPTLGQRARSYAERHWSADIMVARHLALFEALLGQRPRGVGDRYS